MAKQETKKAVRLELPEAEHAELRVLAAKSGVSMSQYCLEVVRAAIRAGRPARTERKDKGN